MIRPDPLQAATLKHRIHDSGLLDLGRHPDSDELDSVLAELRESISEDDVPEARRLARRLLGDYHVIPESTVSRFLDDHLPLEGAETPLPIYSAEQVQELPDPEWQVEDLFQQESLITLFGQEGSFKTFTALDLSLSLATKTPFHGREVNGGKVVYVYAEGAPGLKLRLRAWTQAHGINSGSAPNAWFIPTAVNLMDDDGDGLDRLTRTIQAGVGGSCSLIVVDTLARAFGSADEDETKAMNTFTNRCGALKERFGSSVLVLHHTGWDTKRERGNRSLRNNFDTVIKCEKKRESHVHFSCEKQKDAPFFDDFRLKVREVDLGEGDTSCVLVDSDGDEELEFSLDDQAEALLTVLAEAGPDGLTFSDWMSEVLDRESFSESNFKRRRDTLVDGAYVTEPPPGNSRGFHYTLTEKGEAALDGGSGDQKTMNPTDDGNRSESPSGSQRVPAKDVATYEDIVGSNSGSDGSMSPNGGSGSDGGAYRAPPEPDTGNERDQTSPRVPEGGV